MRQCDRCAFWHFKFCDTISKPRAVFTRCGWHSRKALAAGFLLRKQSGQGAQFRLRCIDSKFGPDSATWCAQRASMLGFPGAQSPRVLHELASWRCLGYIKCACTAACGLGRVHPHCGLGLYPNSCSHAKPYIVSFPGSFPKALLS
jgi:hypothetical protein